MTFMRRGLNWLYTGCGVGIRFFSGNDRRRDRPCRSRRAIWENKSHPLTTSRGLSMAIPLSRPGAHAAAGRHIRVNLLLSKLPVRLRKRFEVFVCLMGSVFFGYFSFYATADDHRIVPDR